MNLKSATSLAIVGIGMKICFVLFYLIVNIGLVKSEVLHSNFYIISNVWDLISWGMILSFFIVLLINQKKNGRK